MQRAVERDGGALEPLQVLIVGDELPVGATERSSRTDEAFLERLGRANRLPDQVQDSRCDRSVGAAHQPAELRPGIVETGGTELGVQVAAEGLRVRHRGEQRRSEMKGKTELR